MRALRVRDRRLELADAPDAARPGECRVRVRLAGICGTDLELVRGYAGFSGVPGHEFVGLVEHAPAEHVDWIGRRVVGEINIGCGFCDACRAGVKEHCPARTVLGIRGRSGAFADTLSLPAANLHAVPETLADEAAVFVEPVAAACRILEQTDVAPGTRVAVLGDGRLGLLVAQVLATAGAPVLVIGRHPEKLAVARRLGLDTRGPGEPPAPVRSFDLVVEATGRPGGLGDALALVRPRGTIVLKSTFHGEGHLALGPVVVDEVRLLGSRCGPFVPALDLLARGIVSVAPLVAGVYPLDGFDAAFEAARRELKVLLRI